MELPEELRKTLERRIIQQDFHHYKQLAEWARQQGYEISVKSLQRYGMRLARDLETVQLAIAQARVIAETLPGGIDAVTDRMMLLAQQRLCMALAEASQLKQADMPRMAHAVAHLSQAALSHQRWSDQLHQRREKQERIGAGSKVERRGGISPETSQALRNALLGLAPFDPEKLNSPAPDTSLPTTAPPGLKSDETQD